MNFLCDKCKQKYHVADEKLRGRAVTRFRCKKCENVIEINTAHLAGDAPATSTVEATSGVTTIGSDAPPPSAPAPAPAPARPAPRPRPATMVGNPVARAPVGGASGASAAVASAPSATPAPTAAPRPAPTAAPRPAPTAAPRPAAPRPRPPTTTGPAYSASTATASPTARVGGTLAARATPSIAPRSTTERSPSAAALLNAGETGWYAGVRDLPVGPLTRKELIAQVQNGDVTADTLVWREGLDDWRPLRNVAELGDVLRLAAQRMSGNLLDEMGRRPPGSTPPPAQRGGKVVPLSSARGHDPLSTARPSLSDEDEDATRVAQLDPAISAFAALSLDGVGESTMIESGAALGRSYAPRPTVRDPVPPKHISDRPPPPKVVSDRPAAKPASDPPPPAQRPVDDLPDDLFAKPAKPAALADTVFPEPAPLAAPVLFAMPPNAGAVPVGVVLGPIPATMPGPVVTLPPARKESSRAGLIVFALGLLVCAVAGGIVIGQRSAQPVVVAAPPAAPAAPTPPAPIAETAPPPAVPSTPTPEIVPEVVPTAGPGTGGHRPGRPSDHNDHGRNPAQTAQLTPEQMRLMRELGQGGPGPSSAGPHGEQTLRTQQQEGSSQANNAGRGPAIVQGFNSSRVANNCWQNLLRLNPTVRPVNARITIGVNAQGRFNEVTVENSPDPRFDSCLRNRLSSIQGVGPGAAMSAQLSMNLSLGN